MRESEQIVIYQTDDGQTKFEVQLEDETVWLTQKMMAELFQTTKQNISLHIKNCFKEGELDQKRTVKEYLTVQTEGKRQIERQVELYNLDVIISVGYRVKSLRGTQFRIWANRILKEHLVNGFTVNKKRLLEKSEQVDTLKSAIMLLERSVTEKSQSLDEARNLISILADFAKGLTLLDDYDHERLDSNGRTKTEAVQIQREEFLTVLEQMRNQFTSALFGRAKDESFSSSVRQIYQTFEGKDLYPSIEEKAAMLLYLVVKNHSFIDGNKRIAAAVFLHFLNRNDLLYSSEGKQIINSEALASLTLLVAESKSEEKDTIVKVVVTILNRGQS